MGSIGRGASHAAALTLAAFKGFDVRLLFIDIDTLRADHLGCAGCHRSTTPNIDALAADGIRFNWADVLAERHASEPSVTT